MSKGGGPALDAAQDIIGEYVDWYIRGWVAYGAIFSAFICGMLLVQANDFLAGGWMDPAEYLGIVFAFLFSSLMVTLMKGLEVAPAYDKADEVEYYLGTKKAPPRFDPMREFLTLVIAVWLFSFMGIMYLDSVVTYDRIIKAELSLPAIAANALLIIQLAAPAFMTRKG